MIAVEHVPLLAEQRRLYAIPRGPERFREYLATITGGTGECLVPPLVAMNPMAREHVAAAVDQLIEWNAEKIAEAAVEEARQRLANVPLSRRLKIGLVVVDDLHGGWTNRHFMEIGYRLDDRDFVARYGWLTGILWVGDPVTREQARRAVLRAIYHDAHRLAFGNPSSLREILLAEGRSSLFAGEDGPPLDEEDLAYSREVIAPWLDSEDLPRQFACLFGDEAARSVGYDPLGLSPRAGFAVALEDARREGHGPELMLARAASRQLSPARVPQAAWMSEPPE